MKGNTECHVRTGAAAELFSESTNPGAAPCPGQCLQPGIQCPQCGNLGHAARDAGVVFPKKCGDPAGFLHAGMSSA